MVGMLAIITNVLVSYFITMIMLLALALAITYSDFPEDRSQTAILLITIVNVAVVGWMVARNARTNGWLWGGAGALFYMLVLYVIGSVIFGSFDLNGSFVLFIILAMIAGSIGGIIGINTKKKSK